MNILNLLSGLLWQHASFHLWNPDIGKEKKKLFNKPTLLLTQREEIKYIAQRKATISLEILSQVHMNELTCPCKLNWCTAIEKLDMLFHISISLNPVAVFNKIHPYLCLTSWLCSVMITLWPDPLKSSILSMGKQLKIWVYTLKYPIFKRDKLIKLSKCNSLKGRCFRD